ncbi:MAG: hypothetical protein ABI067_11140 [Leifsonia sp.]
MSDQPEQPNPFRSRRFVLSMVVVGVIVLCAVIVIISNLAGGKNNADPTPSSSSAPPSTTAATDPDPSVCGLKGYETTGTVDAPPPAKWLLVGTVAAPTDPKTIGPGVTASDGLRTCFAHTPTGALYAASNVVAMGSDATLRKDVAEKLIVPGPGRDAAIASANTGNDSATVRYQIAGYKVLSYDGKTAKVDIAVNSSTGQLVSFVWSLQWTDGDWKFVVTDDGASPNAPAPLTSLGGYTPWSGA